MESEPAVTDLLRAWGRGDLEARELLVPVVYGELRRRAAAYLRPERVDHTLQPTALVHEAYLRLTGQHRVHPPVTHLNVVLNWTEELRQKTAAHPRRIAF